MIVSIVCRVFTGELPYIKSFLDHYISIGISICSFDRYINEVC